MDRSDVLTLINSTYTVDSIGQKISTETETNVFCQVSSITSHEWFEAGRNGLNPAHKITMLEAEYTGQTAVKLNGTRYGVYRTYRTKNDYIELYLEKKVGI